MKIVSSDLKIYPGLGWTQWNVNLKYNDLYVASLSNVIYVSRGRDFFYPFPRPQIILFDNYRYPVMDQSVDFSLTDFELPPKGSSNKEYPYILSDSFILDLKEYIKNTINKQMEERVYE